MWYSGALWRRWSSLLDGISLSRTWIHGPFPKVSSRAGLPTPSGLTDLTSLLPHGRRSLVCTAPYRPNDQRSALRLGKEHRACDRQDHLSDRDVHRRHTQGDRDL